MGICHSQCILFALVTIASFFYSSASAQWKRLADPQGPAIINCVSSSGDLIYAGTSKGILTSSDNGNHWNYLNSFASNVNSIYSYNATIFASNSNSNLFVSFDRGEQWRHIRTAFTYRCFDRIAIYKNVFLAQSFSDTIFLSTDNGRTWKATTIYNDINSVMVCESVIVASTSKNIYRSVDYGASWTAIKDSPQSFTTLVMNGRYLFASNYDAIIRSADTGLTWTRVYDSSAVHMIVYGTNILAGRENNKIICSSDNGETWKHVKISSTPISNGKFTSLTIHDSRIFAAANGGLYTSSDTGISWKPVTTVNDKSSINSITGWGDTIFAGTERYGVFRSFDGGMSWVEINHGITNPYYIKVAQINRTIFAASVDSLYRSSDNGNSWTPICNGLTHTRIFSICSGGTTLYALDNYSELFVSTDNGDHWSSRKALVKSDAIFEIAAHNNTVVAIAGDSGIYISSDKGSTWKTIASSIEYFKNILIDENRIIRVTSRAVFISTDNGANWNICRDCNIQPACPVPLSAVIYKHNIFVGSTNGVFMTQDNGKTWTKYNEGFSDTNYQNIMDIFAIDDQLFACSDGLWTRLASASDAIDYNFGQLTSKTASSNYLCVNHISHTAARIEFTMPSEQYANVTIYTLSGRVVKSFADAFFTKGTHSYYWDLNHPGINSYIIQLRSQSGAQGIMFVKK